jgi:hypothetical protein
MIGWPYANHPPSSTPFGLRHSRSLRRDRSPSAPPGFVFDHGSKTEPAGARKPLPPINPAAQVPSGCLAPRLKPGSTPPVSLLRSPRGCSIVFRYVGAIR